jgi:hypothetical protein
MMEISIRQDAAGYWYWRARVPGQDWRVMGPFRTRLRAERNLARFERARIARSPGRKVKPAPAADAVIDSNRGLDL